MVTVSNFDDIYDRWNLNGICISDNYHRNGSL